VLLSCRPAKPAKYLLSIRGNTVATIMRTRVAVIKGKDNKDVSIGPNCSGGSLFKEKSRLRVRRLEVPHHPPAQRAAARCTFVI
jgi:hypothetical protein